jgi:hypothetical protein
MEHQKRVIVSCGLLVCNWWKIFVSTCESGKENQQQVWFTSPGFRGISQEEYFVTGCVWGKSGLTAWVSSRLDLWSAWISSDVMPLVYRVPRPKKRFSIKWLRVQAQRPLTKICFRHPLLVVTH